MSDLISRQDAIDAIMKKPAWHNSDGSFYHSDDIRKVLSELSSVQPKQTDCCYCHEDSDGYVTPPEKNCHAFIRFGMNGWCLNLQANKWHGETKINYCPMCGRELKHG